MTAEKIPDILVHLSSGNYNKVLYFIFWKIGALSGAIATILTHPQDVIKTRLQFESLNKTVSMFQKERIVLLSIKVPVYTEIRKDGYLR